MISFFILDTNLLSKQKIAEVLKKDKIDEIIIRNRVTHDLKYSFFHLQKRPYVQANMKNLLITRVKGVHFSCFYDKIVSKIPLKCVKNIKKTASAHSLIEVIDVIKRFNPDFILISPVFPTKTHPNSKSLSIIKLFGIINKVNYQNFILLGGVSRKKISNLQKLDYKFKIKGFASVRSFSDF